MKRLMYKAAAAALALALAGCASTKGVDVPVADKKDIDKVVVVDWEDRTLGLDAAPEWLVAARKGNSDKAKQDLSIESSRIVKVSPATGKTQAQAQAFSRAGFAYSQAAELSQKVIGRVGQGLNDVNQLEAVYIAASETKADMSGLREERGFWQKVRRTTADTKDREEYYVYYTVYSMSQESWDALCKKYLMDVMGGANLETETQKKIGALFSEMKEDADKKELKKAQEEAALYRAQVARLEAESARYKESHSAASKDPAKQAVEDANLTLELMLK
ncbi:MAG: hypothetical protein K2H09_08095 [Treponemataceae bacterium]|nr:hypothetical protein [Treponemataceae bacterium]